MNIRVPGLYVGSTAPYAPDVKDFCVVKVTHLSKDANDTSMRATFEKHGKVSGM